MSEVDNVRREFVELWGSMAHFWGISPTTARVFSWLYSQSHPADTDEIMEGLGLSRGAVSMACRELRDWGLIFPDREPGSRRVSFRSATDFEKVVRNIVKQRKLREWDPVLERLRDWIPQLMDDDSTDAEHLLERLEALDALVGRIDSLLESFLSGSLVSRIGLKFLANGTPPSNKRSNERSGGDAEPVLVEESS